MGTRPHSSSPARDGAEPDEATLDDEWDAVPSVADDEGEDAGETTKVGEVSSETWATLIEQASEERKQDKGSPADSGQRITTAPPPGTDAGALPLLYDAGDDEDNQPTKLSPRARPDVVAKLEGSPAAPPPPAPSTPAAQPPPPPADAPPPPISPELDPPFGLTPHAPPPPTLPAEPSPSQPFAPSFAPPAARPFAFPPPPLAAPEPPPDPVAALKAKLVAFSVVCLIVFVAGVITFFVAR
jgi:hypothetical protein